MNCLKNTIKKMSVCFSDKQNFRFCFFFENEWKHEHEVSSSYKFAQTRIEEELKKEEELKRLLKF